MKIYHENAKDIPVAAEVDVLVCGAGPAGLMAAQAAAKNKNLKVMLIEQRGYMGGNLTIGLPILAFLGPRGNQVIAGAAQKFIARLKERGCASEHKACKLHQSLTIINSDEVRSVAWEMMDEAGVNVQLYTFISNAIVKDGCIKGVITESKAGRQAILAKTVIDCTGDADVSFRAGVECNKGDENGGLQPPTLMYCMKGVDIQALRDAIVNNPEQYDMDRMPKEQFIDGKFITVGLRGCIERAKEAGIDIPVARTILITGLEDDEIWVNMVRVNGTDSTDPVSYTKAEQKAIYQMKEITKYLKEFVPGFKSARIVKRADFLGIRESRVIVGKYVMTAEDMLNQKPQEDRICKGGYPVDIHHSEGDDCTMLFCDDAYDISYKVLLPAKIKNLLVAGRCSSMNHEAMAGTRVMSTCMALGEAAGTAARIGIETNSGVDVVNIEKVQQEILDNGGIL